LFQGHDPSDGLVRIQFRNRLLHGGGQTGRAVIQAGGGPHHQGLRQMSLDATQNRPELMKPRSFESVARFIDKEEL
jgi:hypothetical protein